MFLQRGVLQPRKEAAVNFGCPPVYHIFQLEQGNKMVTQINSAKGLEKLSDAGSIIYWNDNHETIVSNIEEIVKKLC